MATFNARDIGEALQIVASVLETMGSQSARNKLLDRTEKAIADEQVAVWDSGLGTHAEATVAARRLRRGYYGKNAPNGRARPSRPYLEWTGNLRESASVVSQKTRRGGIVDADASYRRKGGPIPGAAPFSVAVLTRVPERRIWPVASIERRIERDALEQWVEKDVIPRARRRR